MEYTFTQIIDTSRNMKTDDYVMKQPILTVREKRLLSNAARLMEELVEAVEVAEDDELVRDVEDALTEVKQGKTRLLNDLVRELEFTPRFERRIKNLDKQN